MSKILERTSLVAQTEIISVCSTGDLGSVPGVRKIPWRKKWQPTRVVLPGEGHGQRSLAAYSPQGPKRVAHDCATHTNSTAASWLTFTLYRWGSRKSERTTCLRSHSLCCEVLSASCPVLETIQPPGTWAPSEQTSHLSCQLMFPQCWPENQELMNKLHWNFSHWDPCCDDKIHRTKNRYVSMRC